MHLHISWQLWLLWILKLQLRVPSNRSELVALHFKTFTFEIAVK